MKLFKTVLFISLLYISSYAQDKSFLNPKLDLEKRIEILMNQMTLDEKVGQMNQYNGFWDVTGPAPKTGDAELKYEHLKKGLVGSMLSLKGVKDIKKVQKIAVEQTRLGIPLIIGLDVIHGYKTLSPIPLAESASWDLEAIQNSASVAAAEAAASGINWTFSPNVDLSHDARWGRVMEGAGEDPYLGSLIAKARVQGFQGTDLSNPFTIAACAKHFAGYGFVESGKEYNPADMSNSTLYNMVLPPFKAAKDAGVCTFMNSFNTLNGVPATGNDFLLRKILKGNWNFKGFVVSDWGSINEMTVHGFTENNREATQKAVQAGCDMDMESYSYVKHLAALVKQGKIEMSLIDDAVYRILKVKFKLGLFDNPYAYLDEKRESETVGSDKIQEAVLDMAKKSIVLLKNQNNILPLKKTGKKIALIGHLAADKSSALGGWRVASDDETGISVFEGMSKYQGNSLTYERGVKLWEGETNFVKEVLINQTDESGILEAVALAKESDVVILVLGEHGFQSGEARSRASLDLPGLQQHMLEEIYKVNKNIVLVLQNGRPLALPWAAEHIPVIVEAWQLGTQSGNAIAQVLYGDYNPSGKLPMSFPRHVGQCPIYYNHLNTGRPLNNSDDVFWSHFSDVKNTPLWPFGYGLSFTTFSYGIPKLNQLEYKNGESIELEVTVTNSGNKEGKEVVQLYIQDVSASIVRPVKELKGFQMIYLKAGEHKKVIFKLTNDELGFYNNEGLYVVETGKFNVFVGTNSVDVQKTEFQLN
ncbi:beta-glucosidase BglX [uncultured Flavobacterium sp.]|uniref:beta-glucosidase BglX n=1 Tax=uncultured Flavobacterium sp. TaxID=165435 RepID=UPI0030CA239B